jgi:uncharacterized protein
MHKAWRKAYRAILAELLHTDRVPGGLALGVFFGFVAPPGVQTVMVVALAAVIRSSPLAAAAGVWVTNPITIPLIYAVSLRMGCFLTGLDVPNLIPTEEEKFWQFITNYRAHGRTITLLWLGLMFNGAIAALVTFYVARLFGWLYRTTIKSPRPRTEISE